MKGQLDSVARRSAPDDNSGSLWSPLMRPAFLVVAVVAAVATAVAGYLGGTTSAPAVPGPLAHPTPVTGAPATLRIGAFRSAGTLPPLKLPPKRVVVMPRAPVSTYHPPVYRPPVHHVAPSGGGGAGGGAG